MRRLLLGAPGSCGRLHLLGALGAHGSFRRRLLCSSRDRMAAAHSERGCRLTVHSSRNCIATPSAWQVQLAMLPATRCNSRSEEHTSELQSLMRISYAVFCLKKKKT